MTTFAALLDAIRSAPDEDAPRVAYAQALAAAGQTAEARVVEAELALFDAITEEQTREAADTYHSLRAVAASAWLVGYEQPSLIRTPPLPLPLGWVSVDLGPARPVEGTYGFFPYESLPDVDPARAADFAWLDGAREAPKRQASAALQRIAQDAAGLGYPLPNAFFTLMRDLVPHLTVIESCTACEFDLDGWDIGEAWNGLFVPFYNDQQSCVSWALWVHRSGAQAVVSFQMSFEDEDDEDSFDDPRICIGEGIYARRLLWSSPSLSSFLYRYALENQIWHAAHGMERAEGVFTDEEQRYLAHYRG